MAKVIIFAALVLAIGAMPGSAETANEVERRQLYTACAPTDFVVEALDAEDSQRTGLTEQEIANAVESRLRAARLFTPTAEQTLNEEQYLYINANITDHAFSINVELNRYLKDIGYGFGGYVAVWRTGGAGTHGGNGQYLLGVVSKYLDRFIASYLRVNEANCSK